jgi:hypothetical protein
LEIGTEVSSIPLYHHAVYAYIKTHNFIRQLKEERDENGDGRFKSDVKIRIEMGMQMKIAKGGRHGDSAPNSRR